MIVLFHGDNIVQSREQFVRAMESATKTGEVVKLDEKTISIQELEKALGVQSLFTTTKTVAIERLCSLPKGNKKDRLLELVRCAVVPVFLWEGKVVTQSDLKKLGMPKAYFFKTSKALFPWLSTLAPGSAKRNVTLFHEVIKQDGAELCFVMLARQVRLLLQILDGVEPSLAPFAISKLKNQARKFTKAELLLIHEKLVLVDVEQKTSSNLLSLAQQLDFILISI